MPAHPSQRRSLRKATRLSPSEILIVCRKFVYSPCKKLTGFIEMADHLDSELGFAGEARSLLAHKTNQAFQLEEADKFTSLEVGLMDTVQDHVCAVCTKLARSGRLIGADGAETRKAQGMAPCGQATVSGRCGAA